MFSTMLPAAVSKIIETILMLAGFECTSSALIIGHITFFCSIVAVTFLSVVIVEVLTKTSYPTKFREIN